MASEKDSQSKNMKITADYKLDDDPFKNKYNKIVLEGKKDKNVVANQILSMDKLVKSQPMTKERKKVQKPWEIVENGEFLCSEMITVTSIEYFMYPPVFNCRNDESKVFYDILSQFPYALKSVYDVYKENCESFFVKIGINLIKFGNNKITASLGLKSLLIESDVMFSQEEMRLIITDSPNMVVDMLCNMEVKKEQVIPFIIARKLFDGCYYRKAKVQETIVVKNGNKKQFLCKIDGVIYTKDLEIDSEKIISCISKK
ncbi:hypothetical protein NUSPORA_01145 [Nucleospora cyclopteri]